MTFIEVELLIQIIDIGCLAVFTYDTWIYYYFISTNIIYMIIYQLVNG